MVNYSIYPFPYIRGSTHVALVQQHQHFVRNTISCNLLEMEIFRLHPRSNESEALGVRPGNLLLTSPPSESDAAQVSEPLMQV